MNNKLFWIAPIIVMGLGFLPMPYGYYNLSRLVVCGCSVYFSYQFYQRKDITYIWIFGFIAILYNPIIPVHLYEKGIWMVVNIVTAIIFVFKGKQLDAVDDK